MKRPLLKLLFLLLLPAVSASAQITLPEFGKISLPDMQMKECSFEKNAPALVLLDATEVSFEMDVYSVKTITERRVRIKILSDKGLDYAEIKIPYLSRKKGIKMKDISGISYTLDSSGKIVSQKIERKQIFRNKVDEDLRKLSFTFPGIKVGSVIEYRYTKIETNSMELNPWVIQDQVPVRFAVYKITVPSYIAVDYRLRTSITVANKDTVVGKHHSNIYERRVEFSAKDIASFKVEPYMSSLQDNIQRVEFSMVPERSLIRRMRTDFKWDMINNIMYHSSFYGYQFTKPIIGSGGLIDSAKKMSSKDDKIRFLYEYFQNHFKWDGIRTFYADDLQTCWDEKSGNSAELNLLLLNLLQKCGIKCRAILVSTRENGKPDQEFVSLGQFNGVDIWIPDSSFVYIIDLAQKYTSHKVPPYNILFRHAFALDSLQGNWVFISDNRPLIKTIVSVKAQFDSTENISGQAAIFSYDFAKEDLLQSKNKEEKDEEEEEARRRKLIDLTTFDYQEENAEDYMSPLLEKFNFRYTVTHTNEFYYFQPMFIASFRDNPFVADKRQTDIDMGCNQQFLFQMSLTLPPGTVYESIPASILLRNQDTSIVFKRQSTIEGNQAFIKITIEYNYPHFAKDEYPAVKDFFKKLYGLLNEQIVLKKLK